MSEPEVTALIPIHRTKGNREWLQTAVNSLKGAKCLVLENDGEVTEALNAGLKAADTEWVTAFGSDDMAHKDFLSRSLTYGFGSDVVYPGLLLTDENLKPQGGGFSEPFCPRRILDNNFVPGPALYRREKALEVGGYRELDGLEDWDLWVRMLRAGARFQPAPGAFVYYRIHKDGRNVKARNDPSYRDKMRREIVGEPPPPAPAAFYTQATPGTTYLRCQLPARHLGAYVYPDVVAAFHPTEETQFPEHSGTAIFQFPGDKVRAASIHLMQQAGIRCLVEVDDNYLINPGRDVLKRSQWSLKIGGKPSSRQGHRYCTQVADGVIVTNKKLRDAYAKVNPNVYICPNTVDPIDWPEPEKIDDGKFRILWAASASHDVDIPLVSRALEWASEQPDVEVYMAGLDPKFRFKHGYLPWMENLAAYREIFRGFDVGLCPVKRHTFALYRSDVKALEIAMGGGVPVVSNVEPYEDWTEDRCYRVPTDKDWKKVLKHIVANRDEAKEKAGVARDYTLRERTTAAQIDLWRQAIDPH